MEKPCAFVSFKPIVRIHWQKLKYSQKTKVLTRYTLSTLKRSSSRFSLATTRAVSVPRGPQSQVQALTSVYTSSPWASEGFRPSLTTTNGPLLTIIAPSPTPELTNERQVLLNRCQILPELATAQLLSLPIHLIYFGICMCVYVYCLYYTQNATSNLITILGPPDMDNYTCSWN